MEEKFISLVRESEYSGMAMERKEPEPSGPTVYIRDVRLPLTAEDRGESKEAVVKVKLRSIEESERDGEEHCSYELELRSIKFV